MRSFVPINDCRIDDRHLNDWVGAGVEITAALAAITLAALLFAAGWLSPGPAGLLCMGLLLGLIALAWKHFRSGCHPAFYFLCVLALFQGGRLMAGEADPFRVVLMTTIQFDVSREIAGTVLLALALSALVIYAVCRWNYRPLAPLQNESLKNESLKNESWQRFLPYLRVLFWSSLPIQLYKNYCYYAYARDHGGYLVFFIDHEGMAGSIPAVVRAVALVTLPALAGIFVLENRTRRLRTAALIYFAVAAPVLITGSRGALFSLIVALWYLRQARSGRRIRMGTLAMIAAALVGVGALVGSFRDEGTPARTLAGPAAFIADQGSSLNVTEIAVLRRDAFLPHIGSYLASELESAFVAADQVSYSPGQRFSDDAAMYLNPVTYRLGFGCGSSYVAEAYILGGLWGAVLVSAGLGWLLHAMHRASAHPLGLFLVAMILPDVLWMPRGGLLDWVSASLRTAVSLLLIAAGWSIYRSAAYLMDLLALSTLSSADRKGIR
jgi:oligosaccharide repeat unit polymerase